MGHIASQDKLVLSLTTCNYNFPKLQPITLEIPVSYNVMYRPSLLQVILKHLNREVKTAL